MTAELLHRVGHGLPRFARNDSWTVLALHDGEIGLMCNDGETAVLRNDGTTAVLGNDGTTAVLCGDTPTPVTARSEATRQSMDRFVLAMTVV